jgi:hypothetical protein
MFENQTDISDYQNPNMGTAAGNPAPTIAPTTLIHEYSATEYYIGISVNNNNTDANTWSIKKIVKTGNVWATTLYPFGNQNYNFAWDERLNYIYL